MPFTCVDQRKGSRRHDMLGCNGDLDDYCQGRSMSCDAVACDGRICI